MRISGVEPTSYCHRGWQATTCSLVEHPLTAVSEKIIQRQNHLSQIETVRVREARLAQPVIRVGVLPMMRGTEWYGREVGCLLGHAPRTEGVGVRRLDHDRSPANARTHSASQGSDPGQILRRSCGTPAGTKASPSQRHLPPRGRSPF